MLAAIDPAVNSCLSMYHTLASAYNAWVVTGQYNPVIWSDALAAGTACGSGGDAQTVIGRYMGTGLPYVLSRYAGPSALVSQLESAVENYSGVASAIMGFIQSGGQGVGAAVLSQQIMTDSRAGDAAVAAARAQENSLRVSWRI
jgi:hypothetical protein